MVFRYSLLWRYVREGCYLSRVTTAHLLTSFDASVFATGCVPIRILENGEFFSTLLVGRDFWEFVSGVRDVHRHLFRAIQKAQKEFGEEHKDETFQEKLVANRLRIAASLRREFDVEAEEDFWATLFNNMF